MRVLQRLGGLLQQWRNLSRSERRRALPLPQPAGQGPLLAVGHYQVREQRFIQRHFPIVVERQNIWMIQPGDCFCLPLKEPRRFPGALAFRMSSAFAANNFNGYLLSNTCIFSQVHLSHTPAAQQAQQAILTQILTFQWHARHLSAQT